MKKVVQLYHQFLDLPNITGFATINDLKEFYIEKTTEQEEFKKALKKEHVHLDNIKEDLIEDTSGFRNKLLGGRFGGNREAVEKLREVEANIKELAIIEELFYDKITEIDSLVFEQAALIISNNDEEFAAVCEYRVLMDKACLYSDNVLREIIEAISALDEAITSEELDQWTESAWIDIESDWANQEAADEVNDVNNILIGYREFLNNIGESVIELCESEFKFDFSDIISEDFFGDFWASEMQLEKLSRARHEIISLREKVTELSEKFNNEHSIIMEQIQERINIEWK